MATAVLLVSLCFGGSLYGDDSGGSGGHRLYGRVVEVSGRYAKVDLIGDESQEGRVYKGQTGKLISNGGPVGPDSAGVVTAVQPEYVVVKFEVIPPRRGDMVRFSVVPVGHDEQLPASAGRQPKPHRKTTRELLRERRARVEAEQKQQAEDVRRKWLARLEARGIEPWQSPTDEQHDAALEKYKQMGEEVAALLPGVRLYETRFFLFYSNIPPNQIAPYVQYLDAMYVMMARLFGIADDQDVWLGRKAPVFAFLTREQFLGFEQRYFHAQPVGAYGICHQSAGGEVVIACYRGQDPHDFGQMLVHETSHGFVFRYKTKADLPVWVDEGMAEYIGEKMVPASDSVRNKEQAAIRQLKETRRLGANFFTQDANLAAWQYGAASSLCKFLIASGQQRYVAFIEGMKEGMSWEESLRHAYGSSPEELVFLYGRTIGVVGLGL